MSNHVLTRSLRILVLGLLSFLAPAPVVAQPPAKTEPPTQKRFDDAVQRLTLNPHDPYLQYVVLQLGVREGREQEAATAVDRPSLFGRFGLGGQGRQSQTNLFGTFTGALAVQESLQLDTMRPTGRQAFGLEPPIPPGQPAPPKPNLPATVSVDKLAGPTVPSHPWAKLLGDKKPDVGPLAGCVPEEFYFAEFKSVAKLHDVFAAGELWAGHIFTQAFGEARSQDTMTRVKRQLGLTGLAPELIDRLGVESIAVTGSDPFLTEGSDVTLLVQGRNIVAFVKQLEALQVGKAVDGEHVGLKYTHRTTPDGNVNVYSAIPRADLHVRGNSLPAFRRVLEAIAGKTADGKAVRRLGESAEFKYVRTRMTRDAGEEDGFVYLSDAFVRHLVGPQLKLTERRRVLVYNHLRMIGHAALLFRTEYGRAPKSLEELADTKCAPGIFGKEKLAHPDGGAYSLSEDGMSGVCSKYGRANALTPCIERAVTEVSGEEAEQYKQFVAQYSQYWRTFFDPIAIRVSLTPKQYRLETLVLPLIDNSIYTDLARGAGKPVAMDLLPTPKREIGGVWVHFDKKPLLDVLGPEQPAANPAPPGSVRRPADRVRYENDLKEIGLAHHTFHDVTGTLPTDVVDKDGKPLLSWRVAILPYVEQQPLYQQFKLDEPWDSEHNKKLVEKIPAIYSGRLRAQRAEGKTPYLRPAGKGTLFPPGKKMRLVDIPDGTSNTIMTVEVADDSAVVWTKPDDLSIDPKNPFKGLIRKDAKDFLAGFADGSVRPIRADVAPVMLVRAFDPADGQVVELDDGPRTPSNRPKTPIDVQNDLKQIGLAMHNYHDAMAEFPTTNLRSKDRKQPLLSWRVALLPYLEQDALYREFKLDEPWDSDHNKKLVERMPVIYRSSDAKLNAAGKTCYLVPAGKGTLSPPDGAKVTIASIADGTANTILVVAAAPEAAVIWTKPDDLPFDPKDPLKGVVRPGQDAIDLVMADGSVRRLSPRIDPAKFAAMVTANGGEVVELVPGDEAGAPPGGVVGSLFDGLRVGPDQLRELESYGVDLNKLRRFLKDGIGDQVGLHMHDAPRLLDSDLSGLFGGDADEMLGGNIGLFIRFVFGPSSISIPVKDTKAVDEALDAFDRFILARRYDVRELGVRWRQEVDFYKVPFPKPHTVRCLKLNFVGLTWRVYWGRIGDGLYLATRPFILEDLAAAHANGKRPPRSEPAHALLRVRPENWSAVLPGFNLGWAESLRGACQGNLVTIENVATGWNDRKPVILDAALLDRVARVYGARPFCPEGGKYELSADGRTCRCSIHGIPDDPKQPAGPTAASSTGRLLQTFGGLNAAIRFEDDGLRVIVTVDRK